MYNNLIQDKSLHVLKHICTFNFRAAIYALLIISVLSLLGYPLFFEDQSDLYAPMSRHLRSILIFLNMTELAVYSFCRLKEDYLPMLILGGLLLILVMFFEIYGYLNQFPIEENYRWFFLYLGLSHIGYGRFGSFNPDD